MKKVLIVAAFSALVLACGGDKTYGTKCTMDSDCKTGVGCWCEPDQRDEAGECPDQAGTCLSPKDLAAKAKAKAATGDGKGGDGKAGDDGKSGDDGEGGW